MKLPEEYRDKFNFEIGDTVNMVGFPEEIFEVYSFGVEQIFTSSGESTILFYNLMEIETGDIVQGLDDELELYDFENQDYEELDSGMSEFFDGDETVEIKSGMVLNIDGQFYKINDVKSVKETKTIKKDVVDELLDEYNCYKDLYKNLNNDHFLEKMEQIKRDLKEIM